MAKDKIDKATAIKSILSDLKKGIDKETILRKIASKCEKNQATIYRWFNEAKEHHNEFLSRTNPIKQKAEEEALFETTKQITIDGILSKIERQKILSDIARGDIPLVKHIVCNGVIQECEVVPNWADRKAAIAELNKMDGDYTPAKIEHSGEIKGGITSIIMEITPPIDED